MTRGILPNLAGDAALFGRPVVSTGALRIGRLSIDEPDVALTDAALALEAALLAVALARRPSTQPSVRRWLVTFFTATSAASLLGGIDHGFLRRRRGPAHDVVWTATLVAVGGAALAVWSIAAGLQCGPRVARRIRLVAVAGFAAYTFTVILDRRFLYAILDYLPATVFLLVVLANAYRRSPDDRLMLGITGILLTWAAAAVQVGKVGIDARYLNHNALYHLIQAVALLFFFGSAHWMVARP